MNAAFAVLIATSKQPANVPTVQSKVPTATRNATRHARGFHMGGSQVASRSLTPGRRVVGATRFYQPSHRVMSKFEESASPRVRQPVDTRMSSAMLMASSRRVRGPVAGRAQALDGIRSRAIAQSTVNTLRHRWNRVNRPDLSDGVVNGHHLRRHAANTDRQNKTNPAMLAVLAFG